MRTVALGVMFVVVAVALQAAQQTAPPRIQPLPPATLPTPPEPPPAPAPPASGPPASMKQLMLDLVYPTSDSLFYIERANPRTDIEWNQFALNALALAEAANVMTMPGRAWDTKDQWKQDAKLLFDVAMKAYRGAKAHDLQAVTALNDELYESCQSCHVHYRPGYRRRP